MNVLRKIFFPGVPYPAAAIWHIILGGSIAALVGIVTFGYDGHGYLWLPIGGGLLALLAGWLIAVNTPE